MAFKYRRKILAMFSEKLHFVFSAEYTLYLAGFDFNINLNLQDKIRFNALHYFNTYKCIFKEVQILHFGKIKAFLDQNIQGRKTNLL